MVFRLIFSDIDGTLLNQVNEVTPLTQEAIKTAINQGIEFVPVSARMPKAIQLIMSSMEIRTPIISYNGALIQDKDGSVLASHTLATKIALEIAKFLEVDHPDIVWNIYSFQQWFSPEDEPYWVAREEEVVGLLSTRTTLDQLESLEGVHKLLLMGEPQRITEMDNMLKLAYPQLSIARSLPHLLEIMATGIEKGNAVRRFAISKGVDMAATIAFGDNYNDLSMLQEVGIGVVMGNAPEDIKMQFAYVTADHNQDGIAKALVELKVI